ncbi:Fic family protein [Hazenella coriacea]
MLYHTHPFYNGNKRTALMCLDIFLPMKNYYLKTPKGIC